MIVEAYISTIHRTISTTRLSNSVIGVNMLKPN